MYCNGNECNSSYKAHRHVHQLQNLYFALTNEEQPGNPKPRIFRYEKDSALVNRMGFNNPGSDKAYDTIQKQIKTIPRGINAGKTKLVAVENAVDDYVRTSKKLSSLGDYGVINISSPNTPGLRSFQE